MTSEIEALGDVTTGVLVARAVEPSHSDADAAAKGNCLNCGKALVGSYCHACGQLGHLHRTITSFMNDLLHGVFHFEGKIWKTLPMLVFKPGELTRRYIAGERAKFVSPLAMFLFCTFLMFAVVGSLAGVMHAPELDPKIAEIARRPLSEIDRDIAKETLALDTLRVQIKELDKRDGDTTAFDRRAEEIEKNIEALQSARDVFSGFGHGTTAGEEWSETGKAIGKEWSERNDFQLFGGIDTGWPSLDRGIKSANENPNLFLYRMQTSAYKYGWLLIPISTPMVWLLFFWKRKYKAYDHLVFVTFSLTFVLLMVAVLVVAGAVGLSASIITPAAMIIPPIHMYKQVRGAYASSWIMALIRTSILIFFSFIALGIYVAILLALGVAH
ncbi:MAG: DUF3667 domain-containing protein [Dokdonella sp.]